MGTIAGHGSKRILRLDGIRFVAVSMVLLFHHQVFGLGSTGVDLFFVLSGYLITSILRSSRDDNNYWSSFYMKRLTRIMPPVLAVMATTFLLMKHVNLKAAALFFFFLGDVEQLHKTSIPILGNMWSLAVEEHFYLIWPFLVRSLRRRTLIVVCCVIFLLEPITRLGALHFHATSSMIYFFTAFRLDGLLLGSLLALLTENEALLPTVKRGSLLTGLAAVGLLTVIVFSNTVTNDQNTTLYDTLFYSAISLLAASIIGYVLTAPRSYCSQVLAWRPLVWTGVISYGVYLYGGMVQAVTLRLAHSPTYPPPAHIDHILFIPDTILLILLSWLSFRFYELPIIRWGKAKGSARLNPRADYAST